MQPKTNQEQLMQYKNKSRTAHAKQKQIRNNSCKHSKTNQEQLMQYKNKSGEAHACNNKKCEDLMYANITKLGKANAANQN